MLLTLEQIRNAFMTLFLFWYMEGFECPECGEEQKTEHSYSVTITAGIVTFGSPRMVK